MAAFKFPSLSKKRRHSLEFAEFSWNQSTIIKKEVGSGTFGSVNFAEFNDAREQRSIVMHLSMLSPRGGGGGPGHMWGI